MLLSFSSCTYPVLISCTYHSYPFYSSWIALILLILLMLFILLVLYSSCTHPVFIFSFWTYHFYVFYFFNPLYSSRLSQPSNPSHWKLIHIIRNIHLIFFSWWEEKAQQDKKKRRKSKKRKIRTVNIFLILLRRRKLIHFKISIWLFLAITFKEVIGKILLDFCMRACSFFRVLGRLYSIILCG